MTASEAPGLETTPKQRHVPLSKAVFVTGKGGVGKTLVAAGLALAAAEAEGSAVLVEFGDGKRRDLTEVGGKERDLTEVGGKETALAAALNSCHEATTRTE